MPRAENTPEGQAALLQAITPWLTEARRTRTVTLRHGPEGVPPERQRSCLLAPLVANREVLGYLYADLDGLYGRFHEGDRNLLGLLALQASVALSNVRWADGLEAQVQQRTAEARATQAAAEQRAAELAVINSIRQGIAGSLDLQGIVDLVGDRLGKVLGSDNVSILWLDHERRLVQTLYFVEHGKRFHVPDRRIDDDQRWAEFLSRRENEVFGTVAKQLAAGIEPIPGTDQALSAAFLPLVIGDLRVGGRWSRVKSPTAREQPTS